MQSLQNQSSFSSGTSVNAGFYQEHTHACKHKTIIFEEKQRSTMKTTIANPKKTIKQQVYSRLPGRRCDMHYHNNHKGVAHHHV